MKTSNLFGMAKASILLLALVFAFAITSCGDDDDGGGKTAFDGTWKNYSGSETLILSGSNFTFLGGEISCKGTFTTKELQTNMGTITLTFSQFSMDGVKWYTRTKFIDAMIIEFSGIDEASWNSLPNQAKQAIRDEFSEYFELPTKETGAYTLSNDNNTLTLASDSVSDTYYRVGGSNPPGGDTFPPANPTTLTNGQWTISSITSSVHERWFAISVTSGTNYYVWWNDYDGDGTYSLDVEATAYYSNQSQIFSAIDIAWSTARSFTASSTGTVYIKVVPSSLYATSTGDFAIVYSTTNTRPDSGAPTWTPPTTYTTLTNGQWTESSITSSIRERWFAISVTSGTNYYVWWDDSDGASGTVDVRATAYYSNGNTIFLNADTAWYDPRSFAANSNGTVYIKVDTSASSSTGDFAIVYSTTNTRPGSGITLPTVYTQLTESQWTGGSIPSSGTREEWFRFTATASTQYIHVKFGTLDDLYVQVYNSSGVTVGSSSNLYSSTRYISRTLTSGQIYYIKVTPFSSSYSGTYDIAFNTSSTAPGSGITLPTTYTTMSTANQWYSGNIPSSGTKEEWFRFTATASTQYIHVKFGTLNDLNVQVYDSNGGTVGSSSNLYSSTRYISRTLTSGQIYYIKVTPYSSSDSGTYDIAFNTSNTAPGGTWTPPSSYTTMSNANQWYSGNIPSSGTKEEWFRFTATASTQYIHVKFGTLNDLNVQVYDSNGGTVGSSSNLYSSTRYISRTLTSGQIYYIKVTPYSSSDSGTYDIAFNTSSTAPTLPSSYTTMSNANQWYSGNIPSSGTKEEWFRFTATASTQYIHVKFGTLNDLNVLVYDSGGVTVGSSSNLYGSTRYASRTLVSGLTYYIHVWPYSSSGSGTYDIAFNTTTTAPN